MLVAPFSRRAVRQRLDSKAGSTSKVGADARSEAKNSTERITDGRNHLLLSQDPYDLISIEITSIWISGEGDIYNKEFYELCKSHLKQEGVLQQWVQVHHMKPQDLFVVLNTAAKYSRTWRFF